MIIKNRSGNEYRLEKRERNGWKVIRTKTNSVEIVTNALLESTKERLLAGEIIPFTKISYTVAIETAVVHLLKDIIFENSNEKNYRLKNDVRETNKLFSWEMISENIVIKYLDKSAYNQGTAIPINLYSFFEFNPDIQEFEKKINDVGLNITFRKNNYLFKCKVHREKKKPFRIRLFWDKDLKIEIKNYFKDFFNNNIKTNSKEKNKNNDAYIRIEKINEKIINDSLEFNYFFDISFILEDVITSDITFEDVENGKISTEGKKILFYGKKYERDPKNRINAIAIHGTTCFACGFNFEEKYGDRGKGFIEVHHLKPLSLEKNEIQVDPKSDLIPLCSNCHRMVHRDTKNILSLEELKKLLKISD